MKPLIIDIGSYALKIGFGGEYAPRFDIPLVVGKVRDDIDFTTKRNLFRQFKIGNPNQEYFFGHEAIFLRNFLNLKWISDGKTILDEFFFNKIFEYAMELLKISLSDQPVLISQPFYSGIVEYVAKLLYSSYKAYEIIPTFQPLLNFLAGGFKTGLVVDIGHSLTQITPMINGMIVTDGVSVVESGGKDITDLLLALLVERKAFDGLNYSALLSKEAVAETIKEHVCYISRNPASELESPNQKTIELNFPLLQNETIQLGVERFLAPEFLFAPQKAKIQPMDRLIYEIVTKFDPPIQQALLGNILLTGGTSLLPGLAERLYEELVRKFINSDYKINVIPFAKFANPRYSTFFGAAKLTAIDIEKSLKISRMDFEYQGKVEIPTTLIERFNAIYDQVVNIKLQETIISVKNFYDKQLCQQLYNILNSQRYSLLREIGKVLYKSPLELHGAIEAMLSCNILSGKLESDTFINTAYQEPVEELPVQAEPPPSTPKIPQPAPTEEYVPSFQKFGGITPAASKIPQPVTADEYVPTFQQLDSEIPAKVEPGLPTYKHKTPKSPTPEEPVATTTQYEYTFQKIDAELQDKWAKDSTILSGKAPSGPKTEILREEPGGTFERINQEKAEDFAKDPTIISGERPQAPKAVVAQPTEFTFEKIDQEKAADWEKDDTIIKEGKKPARATPLLLGEEGSTSAKVDKEMEKEWQKTGLVSTPKQFTPKGFFDTPAQPPKKEALLETPTFLQIQPAKPPSPKKVMIADLLKPKTEVERPIAAPKEKIPSFLQFGGQKLTHEQMKHLKEFEEAERKKKEKQEKLL